MSQHEWSGEWSVMKEEQRPAAEWQATLFDDIVSKDPIAAFGEGPVQQILWEKRIEMAVRYLRPSDNVLDLGCGNGLVTRALAARSDGRIVGIDVSGECIRYSQEHNGHPRIEYRQAAAEDLEFGQSFDLVAMFEVLEHVDDPPAVLRRVHDWLSPGGHLVLSTPNRTSLNRRIKTAPAIRRIYQRLSSSRPDAPHPTHVAEYRFDELRTMLRGAGLQVVEEDGAILAMPFHEAIGPLARSRRFSRFNVKSGRWRPSLASAAYLAARKPLA